MLPIPQTARRGPGRYIAPSGGGGDSDPGFQEPPIVVVTTGDTTINGKVKPGSFGKFIFPVATLVADHQYTFRYTPHFAQLAKQGKLAMVGFGLKNGNDFDLVGLKGDGTTGIKKYKINGTPPNGWNKETGHTASDGGASTNGSQAGPNWIRLQVSTDGTQIAFSTSTNGISWQVEYVWFAPTPFTNVSQVTTFGLALWFDNSDAGVFSVDINFFADQLAGNLFGSYASAIVTFEGHADAATTVTDTTGNIWVAAQTAAVDNAKAKYGLVSGLIPANNSYFSTADHAKWGPGTGEFTVECWVWLNSLPGAGIYYGFATHDSIGATRGWLLYKQTATEGTNHALGFTMWSGATSKAASNTVALTTGSWIHCAGVRDLSGGTDMIRLYQGGVQVASVSAAGISVGAPAEPCIIGTLWAIGARNAGSALDGWIDNVAIYKGACLYPGGTTFTPTNIPAPVRTDVYQQMIEVTADFTGGTPRVYQQSIEVTADFTGGTPRVYQQMIEVSIPYP